MEEENGVELSILGDEHRWRLVGSVTRIVPRFGLCISNPGQKKALPLSGDGVGAPNNFQLIPGPWAGDERDGMALVAISRFCSSQASARADDQSPCASEGARILSLPPTSLPH